MNTKLVLFFMSAWISFQVGQCVSPEGGNEKTYTAVTHFPEIDELFRKFPKDVANMDDDMKSMKRICRDVTSSGYFQRYKEAPVNMEDAYDDLKTEKTLFKGKDEAFFFEKVLRDFKKVSAFGGLSYFSTKFRIEVGDFGYIRDVFVCATRLETKRLKMYYVTQAHNVNETRNTPIKARFVISHAPRYVYALAEEPAVAFSQDVDHNIEEMYLRMRSFYKPSEESFDDPICKLTPSKKIRVCAVILNSGYFKGKMEYLPDMDHFEDQCEKWRVSLSTDNVAYSEKIEMMDVDDGYQEWMLPCVGEPIVDGFPSLYFVSRAYNSHLAFVYWCNHLTRECHLKNISKNISPIDDECVPPHCIEI